MTLKFEKLLLADCWFLFKMLFDVRGLESLYEVLSVVNDDGEVDRVRFAIGKDALGSSFDVTLRDIMSSLFISKACCFSQ